MTEKDKKNHWSEVQNLLDVAEESSFELNGEQEQVSQNVPPENDQPALSTPVEPAEKPSQPTKKRSAKKAERKKSTKKASRLPAPVELFDSPSQIKIDLTVGSETKKGSDKRRRRTKKPETTEAELIEKAEEAERLQRVEAVLPFEQIASQIDGLVHELTEEITASQENEPVAETSEATEPQADTFFDEQEAETLEISWGRPPRAQKKEPETVSKIPCSEAEPAEGTLVEESAKKTAEISDSLKPVEGKISRQAAEDLFAAEFSVDLAVQRVEKPSAPSAEDDFWGIPDEPEISFPTARSASPSAVETRPSVRSEPKNNEPRPATESRERRFEQGENSERGGRSERRGEVSDSRRGGRRENRNEFTARPSERAARDQEQSELDEPRSDRFVRPEHEERPERRRSRRGSRRPVEPERAESDFTENEYFSDQPAEPLFAAEESESTERKNERGARSDRRTRRRGTRDEDRTELSNADRQPSGVVERREGERREGDEETARSFPSWQEAISQVIRFNISRRSQRPKDYPSKKR